jgi:hypothetical protein
MTTFLQSSHNLRDLTDITVARKVLGIGTLALQDSNEVNITGGSITVSNWSFNSTDASPGMYLVAKDDYGTLEWKYPTIENWLTMDQSNVPLSGFCNDAPFVAQETLCQVAFTGQYDDLVEKPSDLSSFYHDGYFLQTACNLSDLQDPHQAALNLGLGPLAFADDYYVELSNLSVLAEFRFTPHDAVINEGMFLMLGVSNLAKWENLPIATATEYGMIRLTDDFMSGRTDQAPSAYALSNAYTSIYNMIAKIEENEYMNELINHFQLLTVTNNLSEVGDDPDKQQAIRSNLGLGDIATQNVDDVRVGTLTVSDQFVFTPGAQLSNVLTTNADGLVHWMELPMANYTQYGVTKLHPSYLHDNDTTVPSSHALFDAYSSLSNMIQSFEGAIPRAIEDLTDFNDYLRLRQGLAGINAPYARRNLGLCNVAHNSLFSSLVDHPTRLSDFTNDPPYLVSGSNLNDLGNVAIARYNLGLGSMCLQDSNNVNIVNGIATLSDLTITDTFTFANQEEGATSVQDMFLKSIDSEGTMRWEPLPIATSEIHGTVRLSHDVVYEAQHLDPNTFGDKVASATAVFRLFNEIQGKIDQLETRLDRWLTTL